MPRSLGLLVRRKERNGKSDVRRGVDYKGFNNARFYHLSPKPFNKTYDAIAIWKSTVKSE